jgi:hypothetical protein
MFDFKRLHRYPQWLVLTAAESPTDRHPEDKANDDDDNQRSRRDPKNPVDLDPSKVEHAEEHDECPEREGDCESRLVGAGTRRPWRVLRGVRSSLGHGGLRRAEELDLVRRAHHSADDPEDREEDANHEQQIAAVPERG